MNRSGSKELRPRLSRQDGSALVVVLITAALGTLILTGLLNGMIEAEITGREVDSSVAFYHAEAGLQHALAEILDTDDGLGDDLLGPDGVAGTADDGYVLGTRPIAFGDGTYLARLVNNWASSCTGAEATDGIDGNEDHCDDGDGDGNGDNDGDGFPDPVDSDGIAHLWVRGVVDDSTTIIRATVDVTAGGSMGPGIFTNGVITSRAGSFVDATGATIHANGGLVVDKNSSINGNPGTSGNASLRDGTVINGEALDGEQKEIYETEHSGLDRIEIPEVVPEDYAHLADYRLADDGTVYDGDGGVVASDRWNSWKFSNGTWKLTNVKGRYEPGALFFETDVEVSAQDSITATIIATGSVKMNGGRVQGAKEDLLIVAGGDVKIGGNADSTAYVGNIYLREQLETHGTSGLRGNIVAMDAHDDHDLVTGEALQLSSEVLVDSSLRNPLGAEGAGLTDWSTVTSDRSEGMFR